LELTSAGPVYSKYRLVVVFRMFQTQMECLPLYTNGGKGVAHFSKEKKTDWMPVENEFERESSRKNKSQQLSVSLKGEPVRPNTYVHVTESVMVDYADSAEISGKMEGSSFRRLHELRAELDNAQRKKSSEN
jgi:hypothetical protein